MDRPKVLIADDCDEFTQSLIQAIGNEFQIQCCRTGKEALALLHSFQPDLLVLELMLTELDGISLLQTAAASGCLTNVLIVTNLFNTYAGDIMSHLNIRYVIRKPCDLEATVERIRDLTQVKKPHSLQSDAKSQISHMLHALSVPTKLNGYGYLRQAVLEMAISPGMPLVKELYPAVAKTFGCTCAQVERSIRNAISSAWNNRDEETWRKYLKIETSQPLHRPTNSEFIIHLAELVRL